MVGFTEPNQYEPRARWRETLEEWVKNPPTDEKSWQYKISRYWSWRTLQSLSLREAWKELRMEPAIAKLALDPASPDSGRIPRELFSRVLARSRATTIKPTDDVDPVIITKTPQGELPDEVEDGFSLPPKYPRAIYQPRSRWKIKLINPPGNQVGWLFELHLYRRMRTEGKMSLEEAWGELKMSVNNAGIAIHKDNVDRGAIPPELIGRVVARAQASTINPSNNVEGIFLYPEPRV
jgi:hypothetical protein